MYSIPHQQFATFWVFLGKQFQISQRVPHIFSPIINQLQRGWQRCRLLSTEKWVGGIIFGAQKGRFSYGNTPPYVFYFKG